MKKYVIGFIFGALIFGAIGATAAYVYTARDIGYTPSDKNWSVTNASEALSSLKSDVNDLNQYRSDIVESLVDKGVEVNENSSIADIKNGIDNMSGSINLVDVDHKVARRGSVSLSKTVNLENKKYVLSVYNNSASSYAGTTTIKINDEAITTNHTTQDSGNYGRTYIYYIDGHEGDVLSIALSNTTESYACSVGYTLLSN